MICRKWHKTIYIIAIAPKGVFLVSVLFLKVSNDRGPITDSLAVKTSDNLSIEGCIDSVDTLIAKQT